MKIVIILISLAVLYLQAHAQDWYFAGARIRTDEGVINKQPTKYGYSWIRKDDNKTANIKLFKDAAKKLHKSATTTIKSSSSYKFVAIYKITINSSMWKGNKKKRVSYFKFYAGKDVAQIERILASDTKLYNYTGSERVTLFDMEEKKKELNAQADNPVLGKAIH